MSATSYVKYFFVSWEKEKATHSLCSAARSRWRRFLNQFDTYKKSERSRGLFDETRENNLLE